MHRYRHLLIVLDHTEGDRGLIRYVAMVARLGTVSEIHFVHVLPGSIEFAATHDRDQARIELQAEIRNQFTGFPDTVQVFHEVIQGPLVDQLLTYAAEKHIDLLLVGQRLETSNRRTLARRLAMKAPCSVWMVPEGASAVLRRILVPIDFSEHAADSLRVAVSMARMSGQAVCLALHVYFNEAVITYEEYDHVIRGQEEQVYRQFIAPINCQGVQVTPLFEESANVVHAIDRVAEHHGADLIVMATRGRSRSAAILLGSVTEGMMIESRVPLLAVKHFGARMGVLQALLDRRFWSSGNLHTD